MVVGVALAALASLPAAAHMTLVVSPIRAEHRLEPGNSETEVIQVKNEGGKAERIKVYLEDWQMDRQGNITYARAGTNAKSCAAWLQVNPTDFRLDPGTREVRYTLNVPPGTKPGTYWAAIIVEGLPAVEGKPLGKKMGVYGRIGVVLYETVGNPEVKAAFQDFQVKAEKKKAAFKLTLSNSGLGFYRIKKSFITLKNSQGQEAAKAEIPDVPVLPGATRELAFDKELTLPPGDYVAEAVVDVGRRELLGRKQTFTVGR